MSIPYLNRCCNRRSKKQTIAQLPEHVAEKYGLSSSSFIRQNRQLCDLCDVFFAHCNLLHKEDQEFGLLAPLAIRHLGVNHTDQLISDSRERLKLQLEEDAKRRFPHWPTVKLLHASAENGCHVCGLFSVQLRPEEKQFAELPGNIKSGGSLVLYHKTGASHSRFYLELRFELGEAWFEKQASTGKPFRSRLSSPNGLFTELSLTRVEDGTSVSSQCASSSVAGTRKVRDVQEEGARARHWIRQCQEDCANEDVPPIGSGPKRLIYTGSDGTLQDVRVVLTEDLPQPVSYFALSHTWGSNGLPDSAKLTLESLPKMQERIDMQGLPRTVRDAIRLAHELRDIGVFHIWIDALCIFQGDSDEARKDWLTEGSRMGSIFAGSLCTIAASAGQDDNYGLFNFHDPFWGHSCEILTGVDSVIPGKFKIYNTDTLEFNRLPGLITSRAWCTQELILSRRIFFTGNGRSAWRCGHNCTDDRNLGADLSGEGKQFPVLLYLDAEQQGVVRLELMKDWDDIVQHYSSANLTYRSDRLLAISGLARHWEHRLNLAKYETRISYAVGLWNGPYIHQQLIWRQYDPTDYQPINYVAPSWSWLISEKTVAPHDDNNVESLIDNIKISLRFETGDHYGLLKKSERHGDQGQLCLTGPVIKCEIPVNGIMKRGLLMYDERIYEDGTLVLADYMCHGNNYVLDVYILVICRKLSTLSSDAGPVYHGLILVRQDYPGLNPGRFIRIGSITGMKTGVVDHARSTMLPRDDYEARLPNGDYKITIV